MLSCGVVSVYVLNVAIGVMPCVRVCVSEWRVLDVYWVPLSSLAFMQCVCECVCVPSLCALLSFSATSFFPSPIGVRYTLLS